LDFEKAMKEIEHLFEREGFSYAVIGALALHAYGMTRATRDLDFVTESSAQKKLILFLEALGYETLYASSGYSNHLHPDPAKGRLDFVYVSGETSQLLFASTRRMLVLEDISLPVPRAEHLVAMKIQAMKNDPERSFQEMADILFLMRLPGIDIDEVREYFEKQEMVDKYNEIKRIIEAS
jgi:hypothetical protein